MTSSQPEIVTVPERLVNISSQALLMSDSEETASQESAEIAMVSAANRPQSFPNPRPKVGAQTLVTALLMHNIYIIVMLYLLCKCMLQNMVKYNNKTFSNTNSAIKKSQTQGLGTDTSVSCYEYDAY